MKPCSSSPSLKFTKTDWRSRESLRGSLRRLWSLKMVPGPKSLASKKTKPRCIFVDYGNSEVIENASRGPEDTSSITATFRSSARAWSWTMLSHPLVSLGNKIRSGGFTPFLSERIGKGVRVTQTREVNKFPIPVTLEIFDDGIKEFVDFGKLFHGRAL